MINLIVLEDKDLKEYLKIWKVITHLAYINYSMADAPIIPDDVMDMSADAAADMAFAMVDLGVASDPESAIFSFEEVAANMFWMTN